MTFQGRRIWHPTTLEGHRTSVAGLAFQKITAWEQSATSAPMETTLDRPSSRPQVHQRVNGAVPQLRRGSVRLRVDSYVWVVSLLDIGQFRTIVDQLRAFERFSPVDFEAMVTYPGRVGLTFDEPIVILCTVIWCIARGSDVVSGELGRGTMEFMMAQPIERGTLLRSHAVVSVLGLAMLCLLVWGGIAVGIHFTTVHETVATPTFKVPMLNLDLPLSLDDPVKQDIPLRDRVDPGTYAASTFPPVCVWFSFCSDWQPWSARWIGIGGEPLAWLLVSMSYSWCSSD